MPSLPLTVWLCDQGKSPSRSEPQFSLSENELITHTLPSFLPSML